MMCRRIGKLTLNLVTASALSAMAVGCDKKEAAPTESPATTAENAPAGDKAPGTAAEPDPAATAPAAGEPAKAEAASPATDFAGVNFEVTGAPFEGTQTWTLAPSVKKPTFYTDSMSIMGVLNPRIGSEDGSVTLGSLVFSVNATGVGTYSGEAVDMTLGLEKTGTGGQPMRTEAPHPFTVEVTRWDDEGVAGTFKGTLVRTNDHDGDPDTFAVSGKFAYPRKKR